MVNSLEVDDKMALIVKATSITNFSHR